MNSGRSILTIYLGGLPFPFVFYLSLCPAGRWGATQGATAFDACNICRGGTFSNTSGAITPLCSGMCPPGKYSDDGYAQCVVCGQGKFQTKSNETRCESCPNRETSDEGASSCECEPKYYRAASDEGCFPCPESINCDEKGSMLESLQIKPGYWRADNGTMSLLRCPVEGACVGSVVGSSVGKSLNGSIIISNTTNSSNATICVNGLCLCGQRGPLCAICDENYTRFSANSLCTKCPENLGVSIFFSVLFTLLAAACLWLFLWISRVSRGSSIRPIINAWQTMSIVLLTSDDWPEAVKWVEKFLLHTVNLDIISLASPSCLGVPLNFYRRFALTVSGSAVLVGAPWLFSVRKWWHRKKPRLRFWKAWVKAKEQCLADSILLMLLLYTLGTTQALSHFRCLRVGTTDYLIADFTIECGDATWNGVTFFVTIVILVFSIGAPLGFAYELYKRRDELEDPETVSLLGMLYQTYVKEETRERETVINLCCPCVLFGGVMYLQVECTRHSAYRRLSTLEWTAYLARNTHHTY